MAYNWTTLTAAKTTLGSIANWVNRTDLPTDNILLEAEAKIYERLRVREMQVITTLTVAADENSVSLPSDFLHNYYQCISHIFLALFIMYSYNNHRLHFLLRYHNQWLFSRGESNEILS